MTTWTQTVANRVSMTLLAGFAFVAAVQMWILVQGNLKTPPVEWKSVTVTTPGIRVGDELAMVYRARVNQQCPTEIRSFIREADGSVVQRFVTQGGYTKSDSNWKDIPVRIRIESDKTGIFPAFKLGPHTYEATAIRFCPDGMKVDNLIPPAKFNIIQ